MEFLRNKNLSPLNLIPFNFSFGTHSPPMDKSFPIFKSGVIRDRFATFSEYRNSFQNRFFHFLDKKLFNDTNKLLANSSIFNDKNTNEEKKEHLLSSSNIELSALKEKKNNFLEIFHNTQIIFNELNRDFDLMKNKYQERLKTKVYESENKQIDKDIEKIINLMTQKVRLCETNIKEISSIPNGLMSKTEQTIKDNIIINLSNKIQEFSYEFRKNQKEFVEKLQKIGNKLSVIDDEDTSIKDFDKKYFDKLFYTKVEKNSNLSMRNKGIDSLLESINELSKIFKDLQNVVQEQGTILDRIDYNIEIAEENTKSAYGHLNEANKLQKQSCFRNVTLIIMFIIFVEAILLINKYV